MDTMLTDDQITIAVRKRILECKYWEMIATELDTSRQVLWAARKTNRWAEVALEVVKEIRAEAFPVAWQGLLGAAAAGDVAACKEILNRVDEVVEQTVNLKHSGGIEIKDDEYAALLKELAGISTDGASREGGGDAEA